MHDPRDLWACINCVQLRSGHRHCVDDDHGQRGPGGPAWAAVAWEPQSQFCHLLCSNIDSLIRHAVTILVQGLGLVVVGKDREYLSYTEYSNVSVLAVETAGPGSWIPKFSGQPFVFLCLCSIMFEQILKITEISRRFRKCACIWRAMRKSKMRSISRTGWS